MAIIYSYPTVTPASGDLIVGTDITGKVTKNFTVGSIVTAGIPTHITGTTNSVPLFTGTNTIGNSIITQNTGADKVFIGGEFDVSGGDGISLDGNAFLSIDNDKFLVGDWDGNALPLGLYDETSNEVLTIENGSAQVNGSFVVDNSGDTALNVNSSSGVFSIGDTAILGDGVYITNTGTSFLDIYSDGSAKFRMNTAGDVGIGTTTPGSKLDVNGDITASKLISSANSAMFVEPSATSYFNHLRVDSTLGSTLSSGVYGWQFEYDTPHASSVTFRFDNDHYKIYSGAGGGEIARFTDTGQVGIGTTIPNAKLNVDGDIKIEGENNLWLGGSTSIPSWQINATGNDLGIHDIGGNSGNLIFSGQKMGIGTSAPSSKLEVDGGDIEVDDSASGLILRSPDGTRYRVTVANGGTLNVSAV